MLKFDSMMTFIYALGEWFLTFLDENRVKKMKKNILTYDGFI